MNTFYFQTIANQVTNTSYKGGGLYKKRPNNTKKGSWEYQHIYQIGRDDQTLGKKNKPGDIKPHIPICPYHMPTNYNRYNDPSLHVPYKNQGNIIELKDINIYSFMECRSKRFKSLWD